MMHAEQMRCSSSKSTSSCFFCAMAESDPFLRKSRICKCFKHLPFLRDEKQLLIILTSLWKIALSNPDDPELPSLGIFQCMSKLINGASANNVSIIPYYAAHVIGSYTMNKSEFAEMAVDSGVLTPLMELLRGKMTWVEQRVAVRALGHIASHKTGFKAVAEHNVEMTELVMRIASTCFKTVYDEFVYPGTQSCPPYHRELMGGGLENGNNKAEDWAIQMQSWCLYLLSCFARKKRSINLICSQEFLEELTKMWGGLGNRNLLSGISLIRILSLTPEGRERIANSNSVIESLCNLSRSSDDSQIMAVEILLLLLKDDSTRHKVLHSVAPFLVDLVELRGRPKVGDQIAHPLLQDYGKIKFGKLVFGSMKALEEAWELKVERKRRDKLMTEEEFMQRKVMVSILKKQGNQKFRSGKVAEAAKMYKKALDLCPLKLRKQRIVLHSNRAQCYLIQGEAESAISDTTRALCLSGQMNPHLKSLWRRSQAFDMKGMARESLMDCMVFINEYSRGSGRRGVKIPYYAIRMLNKQMDATWIFAAAADEYKRGDTVEDETQRPVVLEKKKKKGLWRRISIKRNKLVGRNSLHF